MMNDTLVIEELPDIPGPDVSEEDVGHAAERGTAIDRTEPWADSLLEVTKGQKGAKATILY
jgi:hypothetical protein